MEDGGTSAPAEVQYFVVCFHVAARMELLIDVLGQRWRFAYAPSDAHSFHQRGAIDHRRKKVGTNGRRRGWIGTLYVNGTGAFRA